VSGPAYYSAPNDSASRRKSSGKVSISISMARRATLRHEDEESPQIVSGMNRDKEHLQLLTIFHYVVAGLAALFFFFPLVYTTVGAIFIFAARHGTAKPGEELPPEFLGWIFAVIGSVLFLIGLAMAICILIACRSLAHCKQYSFALVMACIECLFIPFGTILGVFTIVVLSRESVRGLFQAPA
jgi:hypothetical protein